MKKLCWLLLLALVVPFAAAPVRAAESENLVRGMAYTVENSVPTAHSYSNYTDGGQKYDVDAGQLTDGARATGGPSEDAWYRAFRSRSRYVTFAFDAPVAVTGFSAGFYHGAGYQAPRYVRLYLSDDGENWFLAGETSPSFPQNASAQRYDAELTVEAYAAKYVRVEFCCDIFACCDEIEVYGYREPTGAEKSFVPDDPVEPFYCTGLDGDDYRVTDIIKLYNGSYPAAQERANNTVEEMLPYIAYLSESGEIRDTMFDAVAFVPCVSVAYPSGGSLVRTSKYPPAVQSDWVYYTDFLFAEGYELDALNTAVGQVFDALGLPSDRKFPVLLTMPYPGVLSGAFGDLDGDGTAEPCATAADRVAIVRWYDEYLTERFANAGFSRLDFVGYYWYEEEMNESWSADERNFTTDALKALRDAGKQVLFDPFYLSVGFDDWQSLGFSGAVMQPNVAFSDDRPYFDTEMLWEFAEAAGTYHLGVEVETNEPSFFTGDAAVDACHTYERYLYVGAQTGYMDALHTFYQGAGPGALSDFCHADTSTAVGKRLRRLYDCTYRFIKGTYENLPPTVTPGEPPEILPGGRCQIPLTVTDDDSFYGDVRVEVVECGHGRAQVMADRRNIAYIPDADFNGEDTLLLEYDDGQNPAQRLTLRVQVGPSAEGASSDGSGGGTNVLLWVFVACAVAAVVAVVAAVWVLKRSKTA